MIKRVIAIVALTVAGTLSSIGTASACVPAWKHQLRIELKAENPECFTKRGHFRSNLAHCRDAKHQLVLWLKPRHYPPFPNDGSPDPDE